MQDATQQTSPQVTVPSVLVQPAVPAASGNTESQAQEDTSTAPASTSSGAVTMDGIQPIAQLKAATMSRLQRANFQSREAALTWLTGDSYAKARTALLPLGVTDSWQTALLQPHQLSTLRGLLPILRNKMYLILDKLISDAERVQLVFERHRGWLEEHLGMEVACVVPTT